MNLIDITTLIQLTIVFQDRKIRRAWWTWKCT